MSVPSAPAPTSSTPEPDLDRLVGDWLTVPDLAQRLRIPLSSVRRLIEDRELVALRRGPRNVVSVPAGFIGAEGPLPELKGTFTLLTDAGFSDAGIIEWLFTPEATMPGGGGCPIDAINAGFKTEVRRRAMEQF